MTVLTVAREPSFSASEKAFEKRWLVFSSKRSVLISLFRAFPRRADFPARVKSVNSVRELK